MILLALVACVHPALPTLVPSEEAPYHTADGWTSRVRHYPGKGPPLICMHGMGANHYNFDYAAEVSLAAYLQAQGWDVWVPEIRGDPGSYHPDAERAETFTFDDIAMFDVPAFLDTVQARTGSPTVHWVGHSMGGMLLYTSLAQFPERISAGVAIASPATLAHRTSMYAFARAGAFLTLGRHPLPFRAVSKLSSAFGGASLLLGPLASPGSLDPAFVKGMARQGIVDLARPVARQAMLWLRKGELTHVDGSRWLPAVGNGAAVPIEVYGAIGDQIVAEQNVAYACEVFTDCSYVELSVANGFARDYGHIDPVVGIDAPTDVWPRVAAFLEEHR